MGWIDRKDQRTSKGAIVSKEELCALLRSVGVSENTVTAMSNAFELGVEWAKNERDGLQHLSSTETPTGRQD